MSYDPNATPQPPVDHPTEQALFNTVELAVQRITSRRPFHKEALGQMTDYKVRVYQVAEQMVLEITRKVAVQRLDSQTIKYPSDWWQAFKKRWFPAWAQRRWPVRYTVHRILPLVYYPDIEIPDRAHTIDVHILKSEVTK